MYEFLLNMVPIGAEIVRVYSPNSFLPVLLILSTATHMVAQNTNPPSVGYSSELLKQAEGGDAKAQYAIGVAYHDGLGVIKDATEAAGWYRKAAEQGYARLRTNLAMRISAVRVSRRSQP